MEPKIFKPDPADEFFIEEGCHILENANSPADEAVSIARARVAPGVSTAWHWLEGITERYLILAGRGLAEVGDLPPTEVGPGDVVLIPADVRQRITNIGADDLVFSCICSPRFRAECYRGVD